MKKIICFYFAVGLVNLASPSECPHTCQCNNGLMHCMGLQTIVNHTEIPENVTSVVYDFCSFKEISSPLMYTNILELKICNSGVESISDGVFAELNALKTLNLRNNSLSSLSPTVFSGLVSLETLSLSYNNLSTLPERIFSTMPSLIQVELDDNKPFHFASEMFMNISNNLTKISCKRCDIRELKPVTDALGSIVSLKELSLSGNYLPVLIPAALSNISHLEVLDLDSCSLASVNNTSFAKLKHLFKLNLSHNIIEYLPSDTFLDSKSTLRVIFLNDNLLSSLDEKLLQWSSIEELHLGNNPWNCDCSLSWIHSYKLNGFSSNATCDEPESMNGSSIFSYTVSCEGKSSDESSSVVVLAIVIPILVICGVVIGCFVFRAIQTMAVRKRDAREKSSFRYSAVYKETVEPASGLKPKTAAGQSYQPKKDIRI